MIVVTIQLIPGGRQERAREIGRVVIRNATPNRDAARADYAVELGRRDGKGIWRAGQVLGFARKSLGAYDLLLRALVVCLGARNRAACRDLFDSDAFGAGDEVLP